MSLFEWSLPCVVTNKHVHHSMVKFTEVVYEGSKRWVLPTDCIQCMSHDHFTHVFGLVYVTRSLCTYSMVCWHPVEYLVLFWTSYTLYIFRCFEGVLFLDRGSSDVAFFEYSIKALGFLIPSHSRLCTSKNLWRYITQRPIKIFK